MNTRTAFRRLANLTAIMTVGLAVTALVSYSAGFNEMEERLAAGWVTPVVSNAPGWWIAAGVCLFLTVVFEILRAATPAPPQQGQVFSA